VFRFDPALFFPDRHRLWYNSVRVGGQQTISPASNIIASFSHLQADESVVVPGIEIEQGFNTSVAELQFTRRGSQLDLVVGAGHYHEDKVVSTSLGFQLTDSPTAQNAYVYSTLRPFGPPLRLQLGVSSDYIDPEIGITVNAQEGLSPKVGLLWTPTPATTVRAAYFKALKRRFFASQTIEPTQVAGFNQFYDDFDGTESERTGVGIDHLFAPTLFAGAEISTRNLTVPQAGEFFRWHERDARAYVYLALSKMVALTFGSSYERFERPETLPGIELFLDVETITFPLSATWFHPNGFVGQVLLNYVDQKGTFYSAPLTGATFDGHDDFWVADLRLGYRLPSRHGMLLLDLRNIFDEQFRFQETDVFTTRFARERLLLLRISLNF